MVSTCPHSLLYMHNPKTHQFWHVSFGSRKSKHIIRDHTLCHTFHIFKRQVFYGNFVKTTKYMSILLTYTGCGTFTKEGVYEVYIIQLIFLFTSGFSTLSGENTFYQSPAFFNWRAQTHTHTPRRTKIQCRSHCFKKPVAWIQQERSKPLQKNNI